MKMLVKAIEILVVCAIIYPMFYLWDKNNVEMFCQLVEKGTIKQKFIQLADENNVKIIAPVDEGVLGKWHASAIPWSPFTSYSCEIEGFGDRASEAWIEK